MTFRRLLAAVCLYGASALLPTFAQDRTLTGVVQALETRLPLPYVNIGIRGKNTGTVADENGAFSLRVPAARTGDTLTFSAVGYEEQAWPLAQLEDRHLQPLLLTQKTTTLAEVVVRAKAAKVRRIGTTTHNPFLWGNVVSKDTHDIGEFATLLSLGNKASQLVQAHIFLRRPTVDTVTFRLNFYRVSHGLPGERAVEQSILLRTAIQNGWLTIDLTKYALTLQNDFYLGFEFLPEKQGAIPAFSYGAQFGGAVVVRTSSLGIWKRESGASLAAYVTVWQ
ncbi:carboxypeptidase-like regulatory domain-containing protein [Hymenobacter sp. J193]|uniref:carboxypeptidase-like regulatory domain-containing protein n=1 Tax=Hymenobacter sp. J193 TaxID=2898429 RepID=UPI002150BA59|nr:carboxypeptidase-like regulatory domain-containing protein [Hymenobacter sp. J193]MCR5889116.1 carboxypeptidase-like regulatory domain-containing protein [Hymenobacter sp. J193]